MSAASARCQQQQQGCAAGADRLAAAERGQAEVGGWLEQLTSVLEAQPAASDADQLTAHRQQLQVSLLPRSTALPVWSERLMEVEVHLCEKLDNG